MKIFKYSLLLAVLFSAAGVLTGCNGEPEGKGDATIGFDETATYSFKESAGIVRIPLKITGEPKSYPITFNVSASFEPAPGETLELKDVVSFTQTEGLKYYNISVSEEKPEDKIPAYVEFKIIDDFEINESRFLTITVTSAEGATIANASTRIEIKDNDNNPYEKLFGDWTLSGTNLSGAAVSFDVNISDGFTPEDQEANADKVLVCWGWNKEQDTASAPYLSHQPVWYINYDAEAKTLSVQVGTLMADGYSFNAPLDNINAIVKMASLFNNGDQDYRTQLKGTWSEDLNTMTFEKNAGLIAMIWDGDAGVDTGYYFGAANDIVLTRK
jgi:hypothetical protein